MLSHRWDTWSGRQPHREHCGCVAPAPACSTVAHCPPDNADRGSAGPGGQSQCAASARLWWYTAWRTARTEKRTPTNSALLGPGRHALPWLLRQRTAFDTAGSAAAAAQPLTTAHHQDGFACDLSAAALSQMSNGTAHSQSTGGQWGGRFALGAACRAWHSGKFCHTWGRCAPRLAPGRSRGFWHASARWARSWILCGKFCTGNRHQQPNAMKKQNKFSHNRSRCIWKASKLQTEKTQHRK